MDGFEEEQRMKEMFPTMDLEVIRTVLIESNYDEARAIDSLLSLCALEEEKGSNQPGKMDLELHGGRDEFSDLRVPSDLLPDEQLEFDQIMARALVRSLGDDDDDECGQGEGRGKGEITDEELAKLLAEVMERQDLEANESILLALKLQEEEQYSHSRNMYSQSNSLAAVGPSGAAVPSFDTPDLSFLGELVQGHNFSPDDVGGMQLMIDGMKKGIIDQFLPDLTKQCLDIKFPPLDELIDLGEDSLRFTTGEISFQEINIPKDKIDVRLTPDLQCEITVKNVSAKINKVEWTYEKTKQFPRVRDKGKLKGKVSKLALSLRLAMSSTGIEVVDSSVVIGDLKLRVCDTMSSFVYNVILRRTEGHIKAYMEQALSDILRGK